jgi:hypothetical protein
MFTLSSLSETPFLNPFGQRSFPLVSNELSKSSVVGVHGNLCADHDKHSYESETENPK